MRIMVLATDWESVADDYARMDGQEKEQNVVNRLNRKFRRDMSVPRVSKRQKFGRMTPIGATR